MYQIYISNPLAPVTHLLYGEGIQSLNYSLTHSIKIKPNRIESNKQSISSKPTKASKSTTSLATQDKPTRQAAAKYMNPPQSLVSFPLQQAVPRKIQGLSQQLPIFPAFQKVRVVMPRDGVGGKPAIQGFSSSTLPHQDNESVSWLALAAFLSLSQLLL